MISKKKRAFSIVELSVVLSIIALIASIIMVADGLIRESRLQAVIREASGYITAINTFYQVYNWYPGDMPTATNYWLSTHNGNGDNNWQWSCETFYGWQHLQLAGLIAVNASGSCASGEADIGINVPASLLPGAGYHFCGGPAYYCGGTVSSGLLQNGAYRAGDRNCQMIMTAEQAYMVDLKSDDGLANSGNVVGNTYGYLASTGGSWTDTCTNGGTGYQLSSSGIVCRLGWVIITNTN